MQMLVRVAMGAVLVSGSWGQIALGEGEERRVPERAASEFAAPESLRGFRGYLIGTLASVGRKGCVIEVANARATDGSRAPKPEAAVGKRVPVHYIAFVDEEGDYTPSAELRARVARLRERGLVTLRVRADGDILICDRVWAGAQLEPGRDDPERAAREGEGDDHRREGDRERDREGEERRREGDREGDERRWREREGGERRREGDREGGREGERRRDGDRERDREGEERRREGDREGDREGEERRDRERDRHDHGEEGDRRRDHEGDREGRRRGERDADF
jgi:hypothetical protein